MTAKAARGQSRKITALEVECEHLRGLLTIARTGMHHAATAINDGRVRQAQLCIRDALRRSDPDATTEDGAL